MLQTLYILLDDTPSSSQMGKIPEKRRGNSQYRCMRSQKNASSQAATSLPSTVALELRLISEIRAHLIVKPFAAQLSCLHLRVPEYNKTREVMEDLCGMQLL